MFSVFLYKQPLVFSVFFKNNFVLVYEQILKIMYKIQVSFLFFKGVTRALERTSQTHLKRLFVPPLSATGVDSFISYRQEE